MLSDTRAMALCFWISTPYIPEFPKKMMQINTSATFKRKMPGIFDKRRWLLNQSIYFSHVF
jgi:hypothetical protein